MEDGGEQERELAAKYRPVTAAVVRIPLCQRPLGTRHELVDPIGEPQRVLGNQVARVLVVEHQPAAGQVGG